MLFFNNPVYHYRNRVEGFEYLSASGLRDSKTRPMLAFDLSGVVSALAFLWIIDAVIFFLLQVVFEGKRGLDFKGDIAIDDIDIAYGDCPSSGIPQACNNNNNDCHIQDNRISKDDTAMSKDFKFSRFIPFHVLLVRIFEIALSLVRCLSCTLYIPRHLYI